MTSVEKICESQKNVSKLENFSSIKKFKHKLKKLIRYNGENKEIKIDLLKIPLKDQNIDFMVDTGAELSVVTKPVAPLSKKTTTVTGAFGEEMIKSFCQPRKCQMGGRGAPSDSSTFLSAQYPCWEETCSPN